MGAHKHFDDELRTLKERVLTMSSLAEKGLHLAIGALVERDARRLSEVHELERRVNALEIEIDERVFALLVRRQPVASDLRFVVMSLKIASEIERISDLAVNIAQSTERLLAEPPLRPLELMQVLEDRVGQLLRQSLEAFVRADAGLARAVIAGDDAIDRLRDEIFRALLTYMMEDPKTISRALSLVLISRNLERVADHATNVAEEVVFMVEGREVRHGLVLGRIIGHGEAPPPGEPPGGGPRAKGGGT